MQRTIDLPGVKLACRDEGAGLPLVLLHGFPLSHRMWDGQFALASRCRVIAPDLRGFGASTVTPGTVTMEQFADDVRAMLDSLQIPQCVLCGLSMGGYVAFAFARKYADRLSGLILCDTRSIPDTPEGAAGRRTLAERVLKESARVVVEAMLPKLFAKATDGTQSQIVAATRETMAATAPEGIAAAARGMAERPDSTPLLGSIRVPTLVLAGTEDAIATPTEMRGIAAGIPGSDFVEVAGAGHMAPLEQPAATNAAIERLLAKVPR